MNTNRKLRYCLVGNTIILFFVLIVALVFKDNSDYWNLGPNTRLKVISVTIDTMEKYYMLLFIVALLNVSKVIIEENAMPVLGFNIYNPDKKVITDFTKNELQIVANLMYFITSVRSVFTVMITISQIDIALFSVLISELTSIATIRFLLNEKKFAVDDEEAVRFIELNEMK
jgi:hypothetical protein